MSVVLFIIVVLIVLALACYALNLLPMIDPPIKQLIMLCFVVLAILAILSRSGVVAL